MICAFWGTKIDFKDRERKCLGEIAEEGLGEIGEARRVFVGCGGGGAREQSSNISSWGNSRSFVVYTYLFLKLVSYQLTCIHHFTNYYCHDLKAWRGKIFQRWEYKDEQSRTITYIEQLNHEEGDYLKWNRHHSRWNKTLRLHCYRIRGIIAIVIAIKGY